MTLTKSWLQKQVTDLEATRDEIPFGLDEDGSNTLSALKLALAGMEAEPVGVTDKSEIECLKRGEMANVMPPDYKGCDSGDSVYLYDGPPVPVSVPIVPKEVSRCLGFFASVIKSGEPWTATCQREYDAASAAMLQSGNSPVIQEGWVACSERMPPENDIVLVVDDGYFVCEAQHREGDFYSAVRGGG